MSTSSSRRAATMDMTSGPIAKNILLFSLPLLAGNIFQQFYNTVDSIVVGNFVGPEALGAVTANLPATMMLISLFMGFSSGASVVISQYFGARNEVKLRRAVHTSIVATLLISIAMTLLGLFLTPFLVRFMSTPPEIADLAMVYLRIYFAGLSGLMFYNMGSAILRAVGDSRRPLYFLIFCSLCNVFLDLYFVIRLRMGVAGVAYATIISQFLSTVLVFLVLFRTKEIYSITLKEMRIDTELLRRIIEIGLPTGVQLGLTSFSNVFVMGYINHFGAGSTSGWGAYQRIDAFTVLPVMSIAIAVTTFVGQNAGARNVERIKQCVRSSLFMGLAVTVFLSAVLFMLAPDAIGLFNKDPEVLKYGTLFLRMIVPLDFLICFNQCYAGALRGMGEARAPMFIMLFSFVIFRQIYLFAATHITDSIYPVALAYPVGWALCSVLMVLYYRHSNWEARVSSGAF